MERGMNTRENLMEFRQMMRHSVPNCTVANSLQAITGEYELGAQHAGNFRKMADDWITWGKGSRLPFLSRIA
jgi:hypothetical protein